MDQLCSGLGWVYPFSVGAIALEHFFLGTALDQLSNARRLRDGVHICLHGFRRVRPTADTSMSSNTKSQGG